jgi:hypothetical protein
MNRNVEITSNTVRVSTGRLSDLGMSCHLPIITTSTAMMMLANRPRMAMNWPTFMVPASVLAMVSLSTKPSIASDISPPPRTALAGTAGGLPVSGLVFMA